MKRLLAYLLAMIMLLSMGAGAFATNAQPDVQTAAESEEEEATENEE